MSRQQPGKRIALLVEGATEKAFQSSLMEFLSSHLQNQMPRLELIVYDGRIPKGDDLRKRVENLLTGRDSRDAVIALTDFYTGSNDFSDAVDAKAKMRAWVGNDPKFYPHAAQYDFEAWLLPYWPRVQHLAGHNRSAPAGAPETINHNKPPSEHLKEIFRIGSCGRHYSKTRDAKAILKGQNLQHAADACPELQELLNTLLSICRDSGH